MLQRPSHKRFRRFTVIAQSPLQCVFLCANEAMPARRFLIGNCYGTQTVRRVTFSWQLSDCAVGGPLIDCHSAHGKPVLCRYAPNPR